MKSVNHLELENYIKRVYDKSLSSYIWGGIGVGKSETISKVAQDIAKEKDKIFIDWNRVSDERKKEMLKDEVIEKSFIFCDIRASQMDASDTKGLPSFSSNFVEWKPNLIFKVLSNPKASGILFLDELNLAFPSILASLYQVVLDRCIGEIAFPKEVVPIASSNRVEDRGGVFELPAPLCNRFLHLELRVPDVDSWTAYGLDNGKQIDSRIITFLQFKPSRIYSYDSKNKDKAFATPRMWATCSKLIKDITDLDVLETLVSSAVGEAVAIEFVAFVKLQRKIDVEDLIKHPEKVKEIKEIDLKYSLLSTMTEYFNKHKTADTLKSIVLICHYMEAEFSVLLLRLIKSADTKFFLKEAIQIKEFKELSKLSAKYLI